MRIGSHLVAIALLASAAGCSSFLDLAVPPNVDHDNDNRRDDGEDNCPDVANPDQSDFDMDGTGDACDVCDDGGSEDLDADGIPDGCDGCVANGVDDDMDGVPDNCDTCVGSDPDGDGVCDCVSNGVDEDKDGIGDNCDPCIGRDTDDDGVCDCIDGPDDVDGDKIGDNCDSCVASGKDSDGDGLDNNCDPCPDGPQHDEDGDGTFDACDDCKAVANPGQNVILPTVDDEVGSACDLDNAQQDQEIFDAFDTQSSSWFVQGPNWLLENDHMRYLGGSVPSYRLLGAPKVPFQVMTDVTVSGAQSFGWYSVYVVASSTGLDPGPQPWVPRLECVVTSANIGPTTGAHLVARTYDLDPSTPYSESSPVTVSNVHTRLTLSVDDTSKTLTCSDGASASVSANVPGSTTWMAGIGASGVAADFAFYDILTRL